MLTGNAKHLYRLFYKALINKTIFVKLHNLLDAVW
jgi:hypothetical protein